MKSAVSVAVLGLLAVPLAGCGNTMRDYLERETPPQQAAVRQDLTMPPDLRLPPPGSAPLAEPASPDLYDGGDMAAAAPSEPLAPAAPRPTPEQGIYEKAGISLTRPDGTKKTDAELRAELREYYIAQKQAKNPKYGTVFNIGNIFKDE